MTAYYPPMGWNSWDCYGSAVNEQQVKQNAEYMAKHMASCGWEYVVVDIQWSQPTAVNHYYKPFAELCMDEYGRLLPAPNRFPSGFKALADHVHSLGLKFGIHIMRGIPREAARRNLPIEGSKYTCGELASPCSICEWNGDMYGVRQEHPGARDYYDSIFRLYAQWGVDYIKCDDIAVLYPQRRREIELVSEACRNCGREMVLSLSPGSAPLAEAEHLKKYANMWRMTGDFWDNWDAILVMFERGEKWCIHAGPGHWPDADMLPVGAVRQCVAPDEWTHFTHSEQRTLITLWCMMRSPLMVGCELTKNDDFTLELLTNKAVLEIGKLSFCAHPLYRTKEECAWIAPRSDGKGVYAAVFNLTGEERTSEFPAEEIPFTPSAITELWTNARTEKLSAVLPGHDTAVWYVER